MLPKAFAVNDLSHELAMTQAALGEVRNRLLMTQRQIESQRKLIELLRKRIDRQAERGKRPKPPVGFKPCCPLRT